jgi:uncharacterized membrane protein
MDQFLRGAITAGCIVIGLFFLRFFRRDRDRLFLYFACAFFLLAADRFALGVASSLGANIALPYWARAFAYLLIIIAIVDKNLSRRSLSGS